MRHREPNVKRAVARWFDDGDGAPGPPAEDRALMAECVSRLADFYGHRGVPVTPLLIIQTQDLMTWWLLARRIQRTINREGFVPEPAPDAHPPGDAPALTARIHPLVEPLAKAWERVRKALKELADTLSAGSAAPAKTQGLAAALKPALARTTGVLEDALQFEQGKQRRAARQAAANPAPGLAVP
ncbi:MAG: hypothetical protein JXR94_14130 [Candidatus Hydrogenedentes bacterium]|nr:hypothetical protein [Candidatus Hydrogenedentota bacterium]